MKFWIVAVTINYINYSPQSYAPTIESTKTDYSVFTNSVDATNYAYSRKDEKEKFFLFGELPHPKTENVIIYETISAIKKRIKIVRKIELEKEK